MPSSLNVSVLKNTSFLESRQLFLTYCKFIIQMAGIPEQTLLCQRVLKHLLCMHRDEICKKAKNLTESPQNMILPGNDLLTNHSSMLQHVWRDRVVGSVNILQ